MTNQLTNLVSNCCSSEMLYEETDESPAVGQCLSCSEHCSIAFTDFAVRPLHFGSSLEDFLDALHSARRRPRDFWETVFTFIQVQQQHHDFTGYGSFTYTIIDPHAATSPYSVIRLLQQRFNREISWRENLKSQRRLAYLRLLSSHSYNLRNYQLATTGA